MKFWPYNILLFGWNGVWSGIDEEGEKQLYQNERKLERLENVGSLTLHKRIGAAGPVIAEDQRVIGKGVNR